MSQKSQSFISRNLITIVMIPSLIGIHLGWNYMQNNRKLVTEEERIDMPPITLAKYLWHKLNFSSSTEATAKASNTNSVNK